MRVTDERLKEILQDNDYHSPRFQELAADLQDARAEINDLREYLDLILDVADDLNEGVMGMIGLHATHRNHPEMDTEEARARRGWLVIPGACAATEKYDRLMELRQRHFDLQAVVNFLKALEDGQVELPYPVARLAVRAWDACVAAGIVKDGDK